MGAVFKVFAVLPFLMTIGLFALELLVAFLQAYVFAMLTCMYLTDVVHSAGTNLPINRKASRNATRSKSNGTA